MSIQKQRVHLAILKFEPTINSLYICDMYIKSDISGRFGSKVSFPRVQLVVTMVHQISIPVFTFDPPMQSSTYIELYCYHYLLVVQVVEETELQFLLSTAPCTLRNQLAVNMTCKYSDTFLNDHLPNCNHLYNLNTTCTSMNYHW